MAKEAPLHVSKEWMTTYVRTMPRHRVEHMIGRALVALLQRQTDFEQRRNKTSVANNAGFSAADAKSGTLTAKAFMKRGRMLDWQLQKWTRDTKGGTPRIAKYHRQLNEIVEEKHQAVIDRLKGTS